MAHSRSRLVFHPFPLAQLAAAVALGILVGTAFVIPQSFLISLSALVTILAASAFLMNRMALATGLVTTLALALGATLVTTERKGSPPPQLKRLLEARHDLAVGEPVELTGVLVRDAEVAPGRWYLEVRAESAKSRETERKLAGVVMMLVPVSSARSRGELTRLDLRHGARIRVMTSLDAATVFEIRAFRRLPSILIAKATTPLLS